MHQLKTLDGPSPITLTVSPDGQNVQWGFIDMDDEHTTRIVWSEPITTLLDEPGTVHRYLHHHWGWFLGIHGDERGITVDIEDPDGEQERYEFTTAEIRCAIEHDAMTLQIA